MVLAVSGTVLSCLVFVTNKQRKTALAAFQHAHVLHPRPLLIRGLQRPLPDPLVPRFAIYGLFSGWMCERFGNEPPGMCQVFVYIQGHFKSASAT